MAEHVDVLIIGAGLSGIGAAARLRREHPYTSMIILESRPRSGGTWDLFRYPGVRSDSDMHTLGYSFRPWHQTQAIADGQSILDYVRETAREEHLESLIRYNSRAVAANWDSARSSWEVTVAHTDNDAAPPDPTEPPRHVSSTVTCSFLYVCSGYYRYDHGHLPAIPGLVTFGGPVIHPQQWPQGFDYSGRKVVVIGSGATAVTLLPAMADAASSITMLQRSPTWMGSVPRRDPLAPVLGKLLPQRWAYRLIRAKNITFFMALYQLSQRLPGLVKAILLKRARAHLPADYDVATHLSPDYNPWDQRLCAVPENDLFKAVSSGRAQIVTDTIEAVTPTGIALTSGRELTADVIVTATGLELQIFGGMKLCVDGQPVTVSKRLAYKGLMLDGVPNFAFTIGYINASWTLKADLVAGYVSRLLAHLEDTGHAVVTPRTTEADRARKTEVVFNLDAGYIRRGHDQLPRQTTREPWITHQNYLLDLKLLRYGTVTDAVEFSGTGAATDPGGAAEFLQ